VTTLQEFRPGLWLTELTLDEFDVRGAVVRGTERALVWDSLSHPRDMEAVAALLGDLPFVLVYSHADWDHVWGTAGLPAPQAIIAHHNCRRRFDDDVPATLAQMRKDQPGRWDDIALIAPTLTFAQGLTVDLGNVTVELHHLPGHTPDCLVAFIPAWGVLLGGDALEDPFPLVNDAAALVDWSRRLRGWADDPRVETVIPCHGAIQNRALIRDNCAYLDALSRGEDLAEAGGSVAEGNPFYDASHLDNVAKARARRVTVRATTAADRPAIDALLQREWGSSVMVVNGERLLPADFPGFLALRDDGIVGLVTYRLLPDACEVLVLNSLEPGHGIGRRLLDAVATVARAAAKSHLTVVTTNDNLPALRLYQRYGMHMAALRPGAVDRSRAVKPEIPATGVDGIPIRDEIELELRLV
jgi:glyoxylase-like metal-dependent hydrolase (beta-lactamase superfamily II)/GNAT superfamily N-acetyltransferase